MIASKRKKKNKNYNDCWLNYYLENNQFISEDFIEDLKTVCKEILMKNSKNSFANLLVGFSNNQN